MKLPHSGFNTLLWCSLRREVSIVDSKCEYNTKVIGFQ